MPTAITTRAMQANCLQYSSTARAMACMVGNGERDVVFGGWRGLPRLADYRGG
jgi:hypothetical protein